MIRSLKRCRELAIAYGTGLSKSATEDLPCIVCGEKFQNEHSLQLHNFLSHVANVFKCSLCDRAFLFHETLCLHKEGVHGNSNVFSCQPCNRTYSFLKHLHTHHIVEHDGFRYVCKECKKELKGRDQFKIHQSYHDEIRKMFSCDECNVVLSSKQSLERHKRIQHSMLGRKVCDVCGKAFTNIAAHKRLHTGEKPHKCDVCSASFAHLSNLKGHKLTHTKEKPYFCEMCGKSYIKNSYLKYHMKCHFGKENGTQQKTDNQSKADAKRKTDKNKKVECEQCHKLFSKNFIHLHIRTQHQGERPYSCKICLKTFTQAGTLKVHLRHHTGERPYCCTVCDEGYVTKSKLRIHKCMGPKEATTLEAESS